ncbi:MAG: hypothetical protein HZA04_04450 [Nitrospinae bacterium]|nr:hypothetical protein [Nitrospinota bacterium]
MSAPSRRVEDLDMHKDAPPRPKVGEPCNGCGLCCAYAPCPMAQVRLWQEEGWCSALEWHDGEKRYRCGLVIAPDRHIWYIPRLLRKMAGRYFSRGLATAHGCDFYPADTGR